MAPLPELSTDLDREDAQPYFIWDVPVTVGQLRAYVKDSDSATRALWIARIMREARYQDVWKFVTLKDVLDSLQLARRHLGRSLPFWDFLLQRWYRDGLIDRPPQ